MYRQVHSFLVGATRASLFLGIALAAALFATPTAAIEFVGKVVGVTDGDTITVLVERRAIKVRLAEIDTPEKGQPYGSPAICCVKSPGITCRRAGLPDRMATAMVFRARRYANELVQEVASPQCRLMMS